MLVCDLHYEKNWDYRRRYSIPCSQMHLGIRPCSGTFACQCKHGDKDYYRTSKTMPIVPRDYPGLMTSLQDLWIDKEEVTEGEEDEGTDTTEIIIIVVIITVSVIVLCCIGYYLVLYCVNRMNKVTYDDEIKKPKVIKAQKALEL